MLAFLLIIILGGALWLIMLLLIVLDAEDPLLPGTAVIHSAVRPARSGTHTIITLNVENVAMHHVKSEIMHYMVVHLIAPILNGIRKKQP